MRPYFELVTVLYQSKMAKVVVLELELNHRNVINVTVHSVQLSHGKVRYKLSGKVKGHSSSSRSITVRLSGRLSRLTYLSLCSTHTARLTPTQHLLELNQKISEHWKLFDDNS